MDSSLGSIRQLRTDVLDIGYYDAGPCGGHAAILLHGFPYSVESYREVAPLLVARGCRVIVPHLRGPGSTRFRDGTIARSGQQAAIGVDLTQLMDALNLERAVFAGYAWGGRAVCVAAALWPERCVDLVSVNCYLIQDIAKSRGAAIPIGRIGALVSVLLPDGTRPYRPDCEQAWDGTHPMELFRSDLALR